MLLLRSAHFPSPIPIVNALIPCNSSLAYHFMTIGCSHSVLNIFLIVSPGIFSMMTFSFGKDRSSLSIVHPPFADKVLSILISPHTLLALVCSVLVSPACPHIITMVCAFAFAVFPCAIACTLYIPGEKKVCMIGVHVP
jgi:hypothetical protein